MNYIEPSANAGNARKATGKVNLPEEAEPDKKPDPSAAKPYQPVIQPPAVTVNVVIDRTTCAAQIADYLKVRQSMLGDIADKYKYYGIGCDMEFTAAQKLKLAQFESCPQRSLLMATARTLFLNAYDRKTGAVDPAKIKAFLEFTRELESAGIFDKDLAKIIRLMNIALTPADRKLAVEYVLLDQSEAVKQRVIARLVAGTVRSLERYDGKVDAYLMPDFKSAEGLYYAVNHDPNSTIDKDIARALFDHPVIKRAVRSNEFLREWQSRLSSFNEQNNGAAGSDVTAKKMPAGVLGGSISSIARLFINKTLERQFSNDLMQLIVMQSQAYVGSDEKIAAFQSAYLMQYIGVIGGMSFMELTRIAARYTMPTSYHFQYDDEFIRTYIDNYSVMQAVKDSPEKTDNIVFRDDYLKTIRETVETIRASANPYEQEVWFTVLSVYLGYANDFGVSIDEYKKLLEPIVPKKRDKPLTMNDLKKGILFARPEDLPREIVERFKAAGAWENVKKAAMIVLAHDIASAQATTDYIGGELGMLTGGLILMLDVYDEDKKDYTDLNELAATAAHEGQHLSEFLQHYTDPLMLNSAVNEREAFITDMNSSIILLNELLRRDPKLEGKAGKKALSLAIGAYQARVSVLQANRIIGLRSTNFGSINDIPDRTVDLSVYPGVAFPQMTETEMTEYAKKFIIGAGILPANSDIGIDLEIKRNKGKKEGTENIEIALTGSTASESDLKKLDSALYSVLSGYGIKLDKGEKYSSIMWLVKYYIQQDGSVNGTQKDLNLNAFIAMFAVNINYNFQAKAIIANMQAGRDPFYGF